MGTKNSRSGGKYTGNHTTLIPLAALICDIAHACASVTKISPGFIKAGLRSVNGQRRIKITDQQGAILIAVRDNASHQQLHVYATDTQAAKLAIAKGARDARIHVSFTQDSE